MVRKNIPIKSVSNRELHLISESMDGSYINYSDVISSIPKYGITNNDRITEFFRECTSNNNYANANAKFCINLLSEMENKVDTASYYREFIDNILPACRDLSTIEEAVTSSSLPKIKKDMILEAVEDNKAYTRVLNNNAKLSTRFDMNNKLRECKFNTTENITESICSLVDTYNMPINKKLNIALEEVLYIYDKAGIDVVKENVVEAATEYFLRENDFISDKEMKGIKKVLNNNPFISDNDICAVNYVFNENISYDQKLDILTEAAKSAKYKSLIKRIKECKVLSVAKDLINEAFNLITSSFIIAGVAVLADVTMLIVALFILIVNIAAHSGKIIKIITGKNEELKKAKENTDNEFEVERYEKVIDIINKNLEKVESNPVKESASIIDDQTIEKEFSPSITVLNEPDKEEYAFNMIKDIVKESKDFADSADVEDLIKRYKAEQNKTEGKFKRMITAIYTKSPAQIIDKTPKILDIIRNFLVLGAFAIPHTKFIAGIVAFCVDKYISMDLKRKEAEKVCNYFNAELEKVEKKIESTTNQDKLDDLEEYKKCLERSIDELTNYRDELYSEKELDAMNNYDEAANICVSDKLSIEEFYNTHHIRVSHYIDNAIQIFKSEILRRCSVDVEEYEFSENEKVSKVFSNMPPEGLITNFMNPDGIINVPLFMINNNERDIYMKVTDICSYVNQYLGDKCMISNYEVDSKIYVVFNFLHAIYLNSDQLNKCGTEGFKEAAANLNFFSEAVDEITSHSPSIIVSELCKNIDSIVNEDVEDIVSLLNISQIDWKDFEDALKDYKYTCTDYTILDNINEALEVGSYNPITNCTIKESMMNQIEALNYLDYIITEAKYQKSKDNKGNIIKSVKNKTGEIKNKTSEKFGNVKSKLHTDKEIVSSKASEISNKAKKKSVGLKTNMALTGEVLKKNVAKASTKEKEISRNIDISMSQFKKSIEQALVSDRREAIIKGSIIPSFSKLIKTGIAGGILFKINPALAAITAIGAFAGSKLLNNKERNLLVDEIEIELQVVEKELENADRDGDMNKYRKLLAFKKKLQRERQRLIYKIKVYSNSKIDSDI